MKTEQSRRWNCWGLAFCLVGLMPVHGAEVIPQRRLVFLQERVKSDPEDFTAWNQLGELCLQKSRETGDDGWLARADQAAGASLKVFGAESNPSALALSIQVDLARHRFTEAHRKAIILQGLESGKGRALLMAGDALLELGDLGGAALAFEEVIRREGASFVTEARLGRLALARGETESARTHFRTGLNAAREAVPQVAINVAWAEVQLGELAFRGGDWETAEKHYQNALELVPQWWTAREHLAELRAAQGRESEAVKLLESVVADCARPELLQALGDLHQFFGRPEAAKPWHARALAIYLRSIEEGGVHYFHHLAGFYADSVEQPQEALRWARKDLELRQSAQAQEALAWALYKSGDIPKAREAIDKALLSGIQDAHFYYHAGLIRMSAGEIAGGQEAMRTAAKINPRFNTFHVHR